MIMIRSDRSVSALVVIILQSANVSNQHLMRLNLKHCCVSVTSQQKIKKKIKTCSFDAK